ncbi:MAG: PKD domain-containing protein, partial [Bacteroidota bacterium]|nr:PKD domain-containing protein [Bacteroidota bacterium]
FTGTPLASDLQYNWDFGDGSTGTGNQPTHTYTGEGTYRVRLIVTNAAGCSDTLIKNDFITIQKPGLILRGLPQSGCAPLMVKPTAAVAAGQSITGYQWNFGDGNSSTSATPSHTYTKTGTYTVTLVVTTDAGCTDTVVFEKAVRVGEKPKAAFINQPSIVCAYEQVAFTDKSTGAVDQWLWDFGGGAYSTEQHPVVSFSDTGWHTVTLIAYNNTCPDTIVVKNAVYVKPPASIFILTNDCVNRYTKQFTDQSLGAQSWFWEFGDGTTSTQQNPSHTYAAPGTYIAKLTVTNGHCSHTSKREVQVIDEKAVFAVSDSVFCRNSPSSFSTQGITSSKVSKWQWDFGDGSTSSEVNKATHAYTRAGTYTVILTITDLLGCKSQQRLPLTVYGATAGFSPVEKAACLKDNRITFNDASTTDGQHTIAKRIWNFGDNAVDSALTAPYQHRYSAAGTYNVTLTVVDAFGCRDSRTVPAAVVIAQPKADFAASDTITCTSRAITFNNASAGLTPKYTWSFGDGSTSTAVNPAHAYNQTGVYTIKLVATDKYGCTDSIAKRNHITITYPKAKLQVSDSVGSCPPFLVTFTNRSTDYTSATWNFGDGTHSKLDTASHFYTKPGTYIALLIAMGPGGCTDTVRQKIVVKGPSGSFQYGPLAGCSPLTVNFTASTQNSKSLLWDFSDGSTAPSQGNAVAHTYVAAGDFVPKMIVTDGEGCSIPIVGKDTIRVKTVATAFSVSATTFCNEGRVQFTNKTESNDLITSY